MRGDDMVRVRSQLAGSIAGDIHYGRGNFSFYFPVVTCILVSLVLTLLWLFRK